VHLTLKTSHALACYQPKSGTGSSAAIMASRVESSIKKLDPLGNSFPWELGTQNLISFLSEIIRTYPKNFIKICPQLYAQMNV